MKKYNILWIDDEYEKLSDTMELAEVVHGFQITKCRFAKEGMRIFEQNLEKWSAVILDAKVLMESLDEVADLKGLRYSRDRINELKSKRYVPMFVLTGAPDVISNELFEMMVDKYYTKGDDEEQLFADVKQAADNQIETQIRAKYADALSVFPEIEQELIPILRALEEDDTKNSSTLNNIRKMLEFLASTFYERGITEKKFTGSNLAECSRDLGASDLRDFVPGYIQRSFHLCCDLSNEGSHREKFDQRIKIGEAPYAVKSTIYCLLNILHWCKALPGIENAEELRKVVSQQRAVRRKEDEEKRYKKQ